MLIWWKSTPTSTLIVIGAYKYLKLFKRFGVTFKLTFWLLAISHNLRVSFNIFIFFIFFLRFIYIYLPTGTWNTLAINYYYRFINNITTQFYDRIYRINSLLLRKPIIWKFPFFVLYLNYLDLSLFLLNSILIIYVV